MIIYIVISYVVCKYHNTSDMLFQRPGLLRRDGKITEETTLYRNNSDVREINCRNDKTIFTKSKWYGFYNDIDSCRSTNWYLIEFLFSHHTKYMHNSYCKSHE